MYWEESLPKVADAVTVVSAALEERALRLGIPKEKVFRIGNGADPDRYEQLEKNEMRKALGLPPDAMIALYMGMYNQAVPMAIRAFQQAAGDRQDALFICLGDLSITHHHLQADVELIQKAQSDKRFLFLGRVEERKVPEYLAAADILLLPMADTLVERARFPIRLGDYLAAGRAVVASDVGEVGRI